MTAQPGRLAVVGHELRSPVAALAAIAEAVPASRGDAVRCRRLVELAVAYGAVDGTIGAAGQRDHAGAVHLDIIDLDVRRLGGLGQEKGVAREFHERRVTGLVAREKAECARRLGLRLVLAGL